MNASYQRKPNGRKGPVFKRFAPNKTPPRQLSNNNLQQMIAAAQALPPVLQQYAYPYNYFNLQRQQQQQKRPQYQPSSSSPTKPQRSLSPLTPSPKNSVANVPSDKGKYGVSMNVNAGTMQYLRRVPLNAVMNNSSAQMRQQPVIQIQSVLYGLQPNLYGIHNVNRQINNQAKQLLTNHDSEQQPAQQEQTKQQCPPVSLLDINACRYHGQLYTVDTGEQSIALKHVSCYGTEGRMGNDRKMCPSNVIYEYVVFKAVNISEVWLDKKTYSKATFYKSKEKYVEGVFFGWPRGVNGD